MVKTPIQISVIVTARNYSKYLDECLASCFNQTVEPYEVIYSDDFSTDDSIIVASKYTDRIVKHKKHVGVVVARNNGVAESRGNVLVHVDGDDVLPTDFLEKHLETFDETTPFVYCAAKAFGAFNVLWKVYTWDDLFIWDRNFVNTSAMIWKDKFLEADGWMETDEVTMWDWSLALRLSRLGKPKKSPAILNYRQHTNSVSLEKEKKDNGSQFMNIINSVRRQTVRMTIGLVYSGRLPELMSKWMEQLIEDISILRNKPQFVIINNSGKKIDFITSDQKDKFSEIKIITGEKIEWQSENERRNRVCELLSDCYNTILDNSTGELIHMREDDMIPENGSFSKIYDFVTMTTPVNVACSGTYLNRNIKQERLVGGFYDIRNPRATADLTRVISDKPFEVDFVGTGFVMFWKKLSPIYKPYVDGIQAHDWAWSIKLKQMGHKLYMIPDAKCKHYIDENNYIIPTDYITSDKKSIKEIINLSQLS